AGAETVAAGAVRRAAVTGEEHAVARVCDLPAVVPSLMGKVEFEVSEEGREQEVLEHLLRRAVAETYRRTLGAADLNGLLDKFDSGETVESGELVPATELPRRIGQAPGLAQLRERLGRSGEAPGRAAAAPEFALDVLFLTRRLSKDVAEGRPHGTATYRTCFRTLNSPRARRFDEPIPLRRLRGRARPAGPALRRPRRP